MTHLGHWDRYRQLMADVDRLLRNHDAAVGRRHERDTLMAASLQQLAKEVDAVSDRVVDLGKKLRYPTTDLRQATPPPAATSMTFDQAVDQARAAMATVETSIEAVTELGHRPRVLSIMSVPAFAITTYAVCAIAFTLLHLAGAYVVAWTRGNELNVGLSFFLQPCLAVPFVAYLVAIAIVLIAKPRLVPLRDYDETLPHVGAGICVGIPWVTWIFLLVFSNLG